MSSKYQIDYSLFEYAIFDAQTDALNRVCTKQEFMQTYEEDTEYFKKTSECQKLLKQYKISLYGKVLGLKKAHFKPQLLTFKDDKKMILADGLDSIIIQNIKPGSRATIDGQEIKIEDESLELTSEKPGEFIVLIEHDLFKDTELLIGSESHIG
ncbi:MAG: hypothetical protein V4629_03005 [Pseudomonadota bacterium]